MTDKKPFVVIGGDAAGLSAASKLKREDPEHEVIVFEKGNWVSYAHCGMPYYVKGEIPNLTDLLSLTPEEIDERGIDLRRNHEVTAIDPESRTVTVEGPESSFDQDYGDLLIATGAHALTSPFDGTSLDGAFTVHDMDSAAAMRAYLKDPEDIDLEEIDGEFVDESFVKRYAEMEPPESVGIVGGGYVGVEMSEALSAYGLDVHIFQRPDYLLPPFGQEVASEVEEHLEDQGVTVHTGTEVEGIEGNGKVERIRYSGEETLETDMAIVGVGIRPNTDFVEEAGIELGESGAVAVGEFGRTNYDDIYAAGDCAEMKHTVTDEPDWVPLGLTANRAGRSIGQTVAGNHTPVGDIAGTAVLKAFDLGAGRTGIIDPEKAEEKGFDPVKQTITGASRSGYYPGSAETTVTLVADKESKRVLGASIVGTDRAAKRIDTVATALDADMTVGELERLDLGYAPPFSPVWDPILVAAKVLNGKLD